MKTTEERLSALEGQVRNYKRGALSLGLLVFVGCAAAFTQAKQQGLKVIECDVLKATRVDAGLVEAVLFQVVEKGLGKGTGSWGKSGLILTGDKGEVTIDPAFGIAASMGEKTGCSLSAAGVKLHHEERETKAECMLTANGMTLHCETGRGDIHTIITPEAIILASEKEEAHYDSNSVALAARKDSMKYAAGTVEESAKLLLRTLGDRCEAILRYPNSKSAVRLGAPKGGDAALSVYNKLGNKIVSLNADENGHGEVWALKKDGSGKGKVMGPGH